MKILLTISFLFSVATAQIKADGKTDDLAALQAWAKAGGKTPLPETKIRITDSWVVGGDVLSYDNLFKKEYNLKLTEYQSAKYAKAIAIKNAVIWLDNPDTTKAVIIYNAQGLLDDNNAGLIENVTLIGKGIGIYSAYTKGLRLHNINSKGFKNGLILNNAYFFDCQNLRFENCDRAEYDIRSHRGNFSNITVAGCKKGFEIRSNQIIVNGYYASQCNTGLHVAAGNNELRSVYLETLKTDGQLLIGDNTGAKVDGNVFTTLTISAPGMVGIKWLPTAGSMSIDGGEAQSQLFEVKGSPAVFIKNFKGTLPKEIIKI